MSTENQKGASGGQDSQTHGQRQSWFLDVKGRIAASTGLTLVASTPQVLYKIGNPEQYEKFAHVIQQYTGSMDSPTVFLIASAIAAATTYKVIEKIFGKSHKMGEKYKNGQDQSLGYDDTQPHTEFVDQASNSLLNKVLSFAGLVGISSTISFATMVALERMGIGDSGLSV